MSRIELRVHPTPPAARRWRVELVLLLEGGGRRCVHGEWSPAAAAASDFHGFAALGYRVRMAEHTRHGIRRWSWRSDAWRSDASHLQALAEACA
jgi:hypothetical protein